MIKTDALITAKVDRDGNIAGIKEGVISFRILFNFFNIASPN